MSITSVQFYVPRIPVKRRARASSRSGYVRMYAHKHTVADERAVRDAYITAHTEMLDDGLQDGLSPDYTGAVAIDIAITQRANRKTIHTPRLVKPDIDNTAKAVLDALNGVAYADDKQVTKLRVWRTDTAGQEGITVTVKAI